MGNEQGWIPEQVVEYTLPETLSKDKFYLAGSWKNNKDDLELVSETGTILLRYEAKIINIVAGSDTVKEITITVDEQESGKVSVSDYDLYQLAETEYSEHTIELEIPSGVKVYTFTFG